MAVVFDGKAELREVPDPTPDAGEALVRILMAGICGTDHELLAGYKGFRGIPGHEMVGVVEAAPDPDWVGARVVSEINVACGQCSLCREGHRKHCVHRQILGLGRPGAFAERLAVPLANLHRVPEALPDEVAVWTEPLAAALAVADAGIGEGGPVLVLGDGRLGALVALGLAYRGLRVELIGKEEGKLRLLENLGVRVTRGEPRPIYRYVVEATGSVSGLDDALAWTRPTGTVILKSTCRGPATVSTSPIVVNELRLIGSRCGDFPPALEALRSGRLPVQALVSKVYSFARALDALDESARPGVFKVLLDLRDP